MAVVLGDGDSDHGAHQDLLLAKRAADGAFQIRRVQAISHEALLEHGEGKIAIGADADRTA